MLSIYQQIFGNEFTLLGKNIQYGHSVSPTVSAHGNIDVEWSKIFFVRWANKINGLPPEGKNQPLELKIIRNEITEKWIRTFTQSTFITHQYTKNGLFYEKEKAITIAFNLIQNNGNFLYKQVRMYLAGIPVPTFMAIKSKAEIIETKYGWQATIQVTAPILGTILKYKAHVTLNKQE